MMVSFFVFCFVNRQEIPSNKLSYIFWSFSENTKKKTSSYNHTLACLLKRKNFCLGVFHRLRFSHELEKSSINKRQKKKKNPDINENSSFHYLP